MSQRFDPERYYRTNDPALQIIATSAVMAQWRHRGEGPAYVKLGGRVLYLGSDLNAYLDSRRVETVHSRQTVAHAAA